jgi:hypothetical protein
MAALPDTDRFNTWALFMADAGMQRQSLPLSKVDLRAAVNAIDDWVDANTAAYNAAVPQPARGALTTKQKAQLLLYVVKKRFEVS